MKLKLSHVSRRTTTSIRATTFLLGIIFQGLIASALSVGVQLHVYRLASPTILLSYINLPRGISQEPLNCCYWAKWLYWPELDLKANITWPLHYHNCHFQKLDPSSQFGQFNNLFKNVTIYNHSSTASSKKPTVTPTSIYWVLNFVSLLWKLYTILTTVQRLVAKKAVSQTYKYAQKKIKA